MTIPRGILSASGGSHIYAIWSTVNKSNRITTPVGGNNLKFAGSSASQTGTGITTIGKSFGKWYWEIVITFSSTTSAAKLGIANYIPVSGDTVALGQGPVSPGTMPSYGYRGGAGQPCILGPLQGSSIGTSCSAQATSQIYSLALDMDGGTCAIYTGGTLMNTITGLTGTWYPACGSDGSSGQGTANFGQSPWNVNSAVTTLRNTLFASGYNQGVYS